MNMQADMFASSMNEFHQLSLTCWMLIHWSPNKHCKHLEDYYYHFQCDFPGWKRFLISHIWGFSISILLTFQHWLRWWFDAQSVTSRNLNQEWSSFTLSYDITGSLWVNSSPPGQNGRHFADDIFTCIFANEKSFWLKFHWSLFPMVQLIITQHCFR